VRHLDREKSVRDPGVAASAETFLTTQPPGSTWNWKSRSLSRSTRPDSISALTSLLSREGGRELSDRTDTRRRVMGGPQPAPNAGSGTH